MKLNPRSLRTRLIALAVALVAFGVLATGIATYVALHGFLYQRLDDDIRSSDGMPVAPCFSPGRRQPQPPPGIAVDILGSDGAPVRTVCLNGPAVTPLNVTDSDLQKLVANVGRPMTVGTSKGEARAIAVAAVAAARDPDQTPEGAYLVFGKSTGDVADTLGKLLWLELIAGATAVAAVVGLGTVGVRLGLRPLERVTRTAQEVAAELSPDGSGLDKRVEVVDPDTEVGQLAEAVNTMLGAVETEYGARYESEQRMRRFLADASHELRTPLTSLRGYAELIRLRGKEGTDPDARDALRRIEAEGTRMSRLVDDLLTLARHDRGAIPEWEPVAVTDVVADAVAGVHAAHPDRTITMVDPGTPATVLGDRDQLLQVVRNVLTNAAIHTPAGPITVTVSTPTAQAPTARMPGAQVPGAEVPGAQVAKARAPGAQVAGAQAAGAQVPGGQVVVAVRDAGPGLSPEQVAQVFDRFWRADSGRIRSRGGSGLGMSIVQALLTQHGGRVTFESSPAAGTLVTIYLPAAPIVTTPPPATPPRAVPSRALQS
ncbi:MAG TPA: HAMP domain-containing sensor histidine kinase [Mycobacteriales bacterium]|nr:HAMP domain-containing sensor histidine kinase [Mycobacteriales bacterium]